jgi:hypothetical protein
MAEVHRALVVTCPDRLKLLEEQGEVDDGEIGPDDPAACARARSCCVTV